MSLEGTHRHNDKRGRLQSVTAIMAKIRRADYYIDHTIQVIGVIVKTVGDVERPLNVLQLSLVAKG